MKRIALFLIVGLFAGQGDVNAQTATQTFDTEEAALADGWTGFGNRSNNFDFGFSPTNHAEGASGPGEGGGIIARSQPSAYYGDTTLFGKSDLGIDLHATGRIKFQDETFNGEWFFGWFDSAEAEENNRDSLGFHVREPNNGLWRVDANIDGSDGTRMNVPDDLAMDFTIDWDADGGSLAGEGLLTVTLTSLDGLQTFSSTEEGSDGMSFDAFGLLSFSQSGAGEIGRFWFDDLEYSLIGEPFAPGDVNADGDIDREDFQIIRMNFLQAVESPRDGDLNFDGIVDFADFREWKSNRTAAGSTAAIPEPTSLLLAAIAAIGAAGFSLGSKSKRLIG